MPRRREGPTLNRQTGYWFFDNRVGFPPNRRRIRFSLRTKDRARAQFLWEKEWKKRWGEYYGGRSAGRPAGPETLEAAATAFVSYERDVRRVKGWGTIESRLAFASEIFGPGRRLGTIGDRDFAALDAALKKDGLSHGTVNHYMKLLKSFFAWAIDQGYHPGPNPARAVRPYVIDQRRRAYSAEEVERILAAASAIEAEARPQDGIMRHAERIVRLLLLTGMRAGELLNLKWSAIRGDRIVLERTETKQRREKTIPVTPAIRSTLDGLERKDDYVLPLRRRRGVMEPAYAYGLIRAIREKTGISDFILHGLRHTASTIMVSEALGKGVGLADIMKILGHSQVQTTLRYQHADLGRMKKAMRVLGKKTAERPSSS
jgi:integrase